MYLEQCLLGISGQGATSSHTSTQHLTVSEVPDGIQKQNKCVVVSPAVLLALLNIKVTSSETPTPPPWVNRVAQKRVVFTPSGPFVKELKAMFSPNSTLEFRLCLDFMLTLIS